MIYFLDKAEYGDSGSAMLEHCLFFVGDSRTRIAVDEDSARQHQSYQAQRRASSAVLAGGFLRGARSREPGLFCSCVLPSCLFCRRAAAYNMYPRREWNAALSAFGAGSSAIGSPSHSSTDPHAPRPPVAIPQRFPATTTTTASAAATAATATGRSNFRACPSQYFFLFFVTVLRGGAA